MTSVSRHKSVPLICRLALTKPGKGFYATDGPSMRKNPPDKKPTGKEPKPSRTDQAREVVEEYANDQCEILKKLRKMSKE